jgi:hypothetical protein
MSSYLYDIFQDENFDKNPKSIYYLVILLQNQGK